MLGVDGGGTKTRAVVMDGKGNVLGAGAAGPSNPLRVGVREAVGAIREATERACSVARVRRGDISAAMMGLAGVKRSDIRAAMRSALIAELDIEALSVNTDADIALYGATGGGPGLVIIAGTGSICCGVNARGKHFCAGGWGPLAGDEGSGSWIARRALQSVARATDGRGEKTSLVAAACDYFNVSTPNDLSTSIYAPSVTNQHIASFGKLVIEAARAGDTVARGIVCEAGQELGLDAVAVIRKLKMERDSFHIGYVGGIFRAGELILVSLREAVARVAPQAALSQPQLAPAEAAAHMAHEHMRLALAG
ncbi:MAG: BadF/BadG/BcrA/BcrD ATPase family protein [Pyrinomonadaceae bacterium]